MIQGKQRFFALVLLISLGLNLFLAGILIGKHIGTLSEPKFDHRPPPPKPAKLRWMIQSLPAESREKIRPLMREYRQLIEPQLRSVRQARRVVHQQLTAPDFNAKALSEALAKLSKERAEADKIKNSVLVNIASQLGEEDRHRLSEATRKRKRPPHRERNCDKGPRPDPPEGKPWQDFRGD